jgi:hypothetical protein
VQCDLQHQEAPFDDASKHSESIAGFLMNEELSDVKIVVGEEVFQAHRVILAAASGYFR